MPKKIRDEIKAIFFDIDGTYFDHEKNRVLPSTIKAMKKLKETKVMLIIFASLSQYFQLYYFKLKLIYLMKMN